MSAFVRHLLIAGLFTVLGAGMSLSRSGQQLEENGEPDGVAYLWGQISQQVRHGDDLDAQSQALRQIYQEKRRIVVEVAAGRRSLLEAASRFGVLNRYRSPVQVEIVKLRYGNCSEEERHCREVIASLDLLVGSETPDVGSVRHRLQCELEQHLARSKPQSPAVE